MVDEDKIKSCFFIAPIGGENSDIRKRSDQVFRHIIENITKKFGYEAFRADKLPEPGIITSQVINHLMDDDLVVADITDGNPNVYYELAIRHCVKKPVILIMQSGQKIPFDVSVIRVIDFNYQDLDSVEACRDELFKHIESIENDPQRVDSPVSTAINLQLFFQSGDPIQKSNAEIISKLQDIQYRILNLENSSASYISSNEEMNILKSFEIFLSALNDIKISINERSLYGNSYTSTGPIGWDERISEFLKALILIINVSNLSAQNKADLIHKIDQMKLGYHYLF